MKIGLEVIINNACDKRCKYCYEKNTGDKSLTIDNIDNIVNKFINLDIWNRHMSFFGGEPTLSLPVIRRAYEKYHNELIFSIITNGYFLNLNVSDYEFMRNFSSVNISLEGTEKCYNILRNGNNLKEQLKKIIDLGWNNIIINISINGYIKNDIDEFVNNIRYIKDNNLKTHLYMIKGDDFFVDNVDYLTFLKYVKDKDEEIYNEIIMNDNNVSDTEFLCTFDDKIHINPDGEFIKCARLGEVYDIDLNDINLSWVKNIASNHKSLYEGCSTCEVEIGKCQTSCPALIKELLQNNDVDMLNKLCMREKINNKLRNKEWIL